MNLAYESTRRLPPLILLTGLLLVSACNLAAEHGTLVLARQAESALISSGHPPLDALSRQTAQAGPLIDPHFPAMDRAGNLLVSPTVSQVSAGMQLTSGQDDLGWIIYAVSSPCKPSLIEALRLEFSETSDRPWLALADTERGSWCWQELPAEPQIEVGLDPGRNFLADGSLLFTIAVYGGGTAVFAGGELVQRSGDDVEPPAPEPADQPDEEALELVGAYLSMGYWHQALVEDTFTELAELGVNFVIDYALEPPQDEYWEAGLERYLDRARQLGIGVAFPVYPELAGMTPLAADGFIDAAVARVRGLKDQPGITAWYVHDEILPWIAGEAGTTKYSMSLEQMKALYAAVRAEDPGRPVLNVWHFLPTYNQLHLVYGDEFLPYGRPSWMDDPTAFEQAMRELVQATCDWVLVDMYPVGAPWDDTEGVSPALHVAALTRRAAYLKADAQSLYFVFQAFSWAQYDPVAAAGAPFPNREQLDLMLAAAHQEGATGAIAYSWFDLTGDLPGRDIPGRSQALADLKDVLAALTATGWPAGEPVETPAGPVLPPPTGVVPEPPTGGD